MPRSALAWALALIVVGSIAVALCVATAPMLDPAASRDLTDSPYLLLSFVGLAILAGLAGWFVPQTGFLWGLIAAAPFLIYFVVTVVKDIGKDDQGLWPIGLLFLVGLTLIPVLAALTTSLIARGR